MYDRIAVTTVAPVARAISDSRIFPIGVFALNLISLSSTCLRKKVLKWGTSEETSGTRLHKHRKEEVVGQSCLSVGSKMREKTDKSESCCEMKSIVVATLSRRL